jgi:prophage antirepressor-like protein
MEIIKTFDFNGNLLSVYGTNEKPLFKAKDVALMLGYVNSRDAINKHVDNEDKTTVAKRDGGFMTLINESGLYTLIFGSKLKDAKKFKHWVTSVVLPSIRKTGKYELRPAFIRTNHQLVITDERSLQHEVINFLRKREDKYHLKIVVPLGELQDTINKRLESSKMGYEKGQPDIIINNPSIHHNGMIIELKSPKGNGKLSDSQIEVINRYRDDGYRIIVSNDLTEVVEKLTHWFSHIRLQCRYCRSKFKTSESRKKHYVCFHKIATINLSNYI